MAGHGFPPDRGLTARMLVTMFLLGLLYVAFVGVLIALGVSFAVIIAVVVIAFALQYFLADRIAIFGMRARLVTPEEEPRLHGIVDRLCALANMPKPKIAVADTDVPNAFATGRDRRHAVLCVTTGLMRRLDEPELEGVLAHELSHVAHRDMAVMTIASFVAILAGLITRFAIYAEFFGGGMGGGRRGGGRGQMALLLLLVLLVSAVVYAIGFLLTRALSRYRELAADRSGAILTERPSALASALVKISGELGRIPTKDLRAAEAFNAFFFVPALAEGFSLSSLFSTHPSLDKRLAQLDRLEAQMGHVS